MRARLPVPSILANDTIVRDMVKLIGIACVALRCAAAAAAQLEAVSVTTPLGRFIGSSDSSLHGGVESFVGIQYAKVPTRFDRSVMMKSGDYPPAIVARDFGPSCYQTPGDYPWFTEEVEQSEECLYLNIWRPMHTQEKDRL